MSNSSMVNIRSGGKDKTDFSVGMRMEAVDTRNPPIVRVASVSAVDGRRIKVLLLMII